MNSSNYDVIVVGAGAAGLTAAIGLARAGFAVAAVEAAAFPGAENWSGCVYFCENLAHPDILGPTGVEALAWERRLVERGFFATDGQGLLGMTYRDPAAFRHCYTVLRPVYDHHLAQVALSHGVALLNETTVESLIREDHRVVGVSTNRGPLYADLVFLAEGDASHLVTREGYERFTDAREAPKFLQGIKQVIDMPPGAIEEVFGVGPAEGVAYEILVRNGSLRGRDVHLNMGGFLYTNRQSLSVGLVLPLDNLHDHFGGDPNLLMEWFEGLPALRPWLRDGKQGVFGAKLIRGGGAKDIPHLIDDGLAIGGAASAIGIDFPYPNFTGPATAMGLLLAQAARRIREEGGGFTKERLRRHYLEPLQQTHYWHDVEFLRRWPSYVKKTRVFFDRNLDLALSSAYVWTRPDRWPVTKWWNWVRLLLHVAGPGHWRELRTDLRHLVRALRLREVLSRPALGRLLLDGTVNALRDIFGRPRANLAPAGQVQLHYSVAGGAEPAGAVPRALTRWFGRFGPILASAARRVYTNNDTPLRDKLPSATALMLRQVNILDLLAAGGLGLAVGVTSLVLAGWDRLAGLVGRRKSRLTAPGLYRRYALAARRATDLTPATATAARAWEARLARLAYHTAKTSHIHVLWPKTLQDKNAIVGDGLWNICPAHVYEARVSPLGQLQVIVNFENCIKCETCWRGSDRVDWGRDGKQRFIYPVGSPVVPRLLEAVHAAGLARPALPRATDPWQAILRALGDQLQADPADGPNGHDSGLGGELRGLLAKLERKLEEFDEALAEEPRTVDRGRAEYLELLARYAQQLAARVVEELRNSPQADSPRAGQGAAHRKLLQIAGVLLTRAEERARRTWDQRFAWASADGRQIRQHHLVGLRRILSLLAGGTSPVPAPDPARAWLRVEEDGKAVADTLADWSARLDAVLGPAAWRELERQVPLTSEQDAVLRDLAARVPLPDPNNLACTLHPPLRKALLAELGKRDPSLAYRVACHLWARDLAHLASGSAALRQSAQRWARGDEWACFTLLDGVETPGREGEAARWKGEALFVPARDAQAVLVLFRDRLVVFPADHAGLVLVPLATLGLRGAGLSRVRLDGLLLPDGRVAVDYHRIHRVWSILSAADLTSIASGMADQLCRRAVAHAIGRVQFPGLFHDEDARDTIGKFGAVKKMVAEMEARRFLIETLDHNVSPVDFSSTSFERAGQVKALVAEALGTAPGSLSYNAGQIFGGTGYSEDDILAKFYRDAAAWRFLGPTNSGVHARRGQALLSNWRANSQRLGNVSDEVQLFEQVAQRKALQAELDEIRNARSRLKAVVGDWQSALSHTPAGPVAPAPEGEEAVSAPALFMGQGGRKAEEERPFSAAAVAEVTEALARQDAFLLASKALLLRTHARLEQGLNAEAEVALLRVWLDRASSAMEEFEAGVRHYLDAAGRRDDRPVVEPGAGPLVTIYADYLAAPCPYESGDFLATPVDLRQPRLVPEMVEADPALAVTDRRFRELLSQHFGRPRDDGLPYERHIERQHRPDPEDLDFCRQHGFFRMPIPQNLGGEGRPKIDYYLLTTNAQRLADVAISLTIQANTSIGSTPVLLARDKDLPKAQKDLGPFVGDPGLQQEIHKRLEDLQSRLASGKPRRIEQALRDLQRRLQETVLGRPVLKVLAYRFLDSWQECTRAATAFDLPGLKNHLAEALTRWKEACARSADVHAELGRRRDACDLFLRWVASGQVSAFALTEPSAGSDTARVATRARLHSVPVEAGPDGVLSFVPEGGQEPRHLLDAKRLEFHTGPSDALHDNQVYYRWSDTAEPSPVRFDEYDYESDDATRLRYYEHGGRRVYFTDIAQLRERDGRLWYDYWELTGAKMWITNGRMAGVMCLYAKTEEGVTGFMVDRHAEGLVVGKDEAKMGQCGSPTNELSLQAVRVPRENVIGLEGRGQVNALETLNVGRAGLAMSAVAQMAGLNQQSRAFARETYGEVPDWVHWRLERMEEIAFIAEALAYEVIGRFEHPQTKSVRMESAISKLLASELLHRVIELAEETHGLAGQTQLHLVEKRKRDARILNIYEGTNEVQRFFILKDLAAEVAPRWSQRPAPPPHHVGREVLELEALRGNVRQRIEAALAMFGQELWQNPNLQASCFLLAEAAAWLKAAESTLGRLAWLSRVGQADEDADSSPKMELARRALARAAAAVRQRLQRFEEESGHLRRGYYGPEVRAASLFFNRAAGTPPDVRVSSHITQPLSVLVVVEPSAAEVPHPQVAGGRLLEPYFSLSEADRSVLEVALRLRDQAAAQVSIEVAAVGPRAVGQVLRQALSLGVDRARLVVADGTAVTADSTASALAAALGTGSRFDLILGGSAGSGEEGLVAQLAAEALGVPFVGTAVQLAAQVTDAESTVVLVGADGRQQRTRSLPAMVAVEPGTVALRLFTTSAYLAGLAKAVETQRWPRKLAPRPALLAAQTTEASPVEERPHPLTPREAAGQVFDELGLTGSAVVPHPFEGAIEDVTHPSLLDGEGTPGGKVIAVLAADAASLFHPAAQATLRAARVAAATLKAGVSVLLLAPESEELQRRALGQMGKWHRGDVVILPAGQAAPAVRTRLLLECWPNLVAAPRAVVGEPWTGPAFAALGFRPQTRGMVVLGVRRLSADGDGLVLETARAHGKLAVRQTVPADADVPCWVALAEAAEVEGLEPLGYQESSRVQRWTPRLERFYGRAEIQRLLDELKQETGLARLTDADFIIDVGFGVGDRDGYEAVIEPLEQALRRLGVRSLVVGGSRKVTEELHLLPPERQIGQSGVSVNPQVLVAIGISGAPQHLNYIGPRATILAFNRDAEAPVMTLNQRQLRPRVFPVVGDLFETVPAFTAALLQEYSGQSELPAELVNKNLLTERNLGTASA
ncbi:MAG TPA: acyl-CoA dehydrogenase family protein [Gemmataceae bacterium]|nr:acyl-CoA dehydrogenase family protein [Gemmataceae bacterium]